MTVSTIPQVQAEMLLGTAVTADTFILLEVPQPWTKPALLSEGVPEALRQVVKSLLGPESGVRVHLIANGQTVAQGPRRILIFQRPSAAATSPDLTYRLANGYQSWEIQVETAADMAPALSAWSAQGAATGLLAPANARHLMICTHASHNECCGIYGYPFYEAAIAQIQQLGLTVQPWQISHIGGHRFAPTLIDFPQGRYYGNLNPAALTSLLTQQGDLASLLATYRGWSLLPKPLQILEAKLWQDHGWSWLQGQVAGQILDQSSDRQRTWAELWFTSANQRSRYIAEIDKHQVRRYQRESDLVSPLHRKTG
ncbi:MAG: sucrase ferredoxin [Leptolyngbyaceae cyanobacterium]